MSAHIRCFLAATVLAVLVACGGCSTHVADVRNYMRPDAVAFSRVALLSNLAVHQIYRDGLENSILRELEAAGVEVELFQRPSVLVGPPMRAWPDEVLAFAPHAVMYLSGVMGTPGDPRSNEWVRQSCIAVRVEGFESHDYIWYGKLCHQPRDRWAQLSDERARKLAREIVARLRADGVLP